MSFQAGVKPHNTTDLDLSREQYCGVDSSHALHAGGARYSGRSILREWKRQPCKFVPSSLPGLELGIVCECQQALSKSLKHSPAVCSGGQFLWRCDPSEP